MNSLSPPPLPGGTVLTYRFRVKDKHAARLNAQARGVNLVWNFCNETQQKALRDHRLLSANDLGRLCSGATKAGLDALSNTVEQVCRQYDRSRREKRRPWLKWRGQKSLGWIPVKDRDVVHRGGAFVFRGERYDAWITRPLAEGQRFGVSSFSQDARGRWYLNLTVEAPKLTPAPSAPVGIDLGLKTMATLSTGAEIATLGAYRRDEARLGQAQRGRRKRLARRIHAKIAARRRDHLHKASAKLAREHGLIVVGDISSSKLAKTRFAKSVLDAGWSDFRRMLSYKAMRHGGRYVEVSEAYTTQTCSECGCIAGPKGRAGLNERVWRCDCGAAHCRDVNAARNILRLGLETLAAGAAKAEKSTLTIGEVA